MSNINLEALWGLTYGVYVVTSRDGERWNGQVSTTVMQIADNPLLLSVSVHKKNLTHEFIAKSGVWAVAVLEKETPLEFIGRFGFKSGRELDKFAGVACKQGATGSPLLIDHALATLETRVTGKIDAGSHTVFVGELVGAELLKGGRPLTYAHYRQTKKGKTHPNAPSYLVFEQAIVQSAAINAPQTHVCDVCGYVYDPRVGDPDHGIAPGTPFEALPDDWVCPVCAADKEKFS